MNINTLLTTITEGISHHSMLNEITISLTSLQQKPTDNLIQVHNQIRKQIRKTLLQYRVLVACKKVAQRRVKYIALCKDVTNINALDMLMHLVSQSTVYMLILMNQKMPTLPPVDVILPTTVKLNQQYPLLQKMKLPPAQCQFLLQTQYRTRCPLFASCHQLLHIWKNSTLPILLRIISEKTYQSPHFSSTSPRPWQLHTSFIHYNNPHCKKTTTSTKTTPAPRKHKKQPLTTRHTLG